MRWTPGRIALLAGVVLYLSVALLVPLGALALEAVRTGLGNIVRELLTPEALYALRQSVILAVIAVVANGVFGVAAAIVLVRHRFIGRATIDALIDLTLAVSPVMTASLNGRVDRRLGRLI